MTKHYIKDAYPRFCVRFLHTVLLGLLLFLPLSIGRPASADTVITDSANMLSSDEAEELRDYCDTILKLYDTSIYIVTSDKIGAHDDYEGYMEQIGNADNAPENMVLLFISTKSGGHVYQIYGYGKAETYMTHDRCNNVMDRMQSDLTDKEYFEALRTFCEEVQRYLGKNPKFDSLVFRPVPQLIFSLLLAVFIIFMMVRNTTGRNTTTVNTYIDHNHSRLLGRIDHFTHMTVSRVKKPDNDSNNSGGGRSHSSGNSHSF